jgi:hypothetical protein
MVGPSQTHTCPLGWADVQPTGMIGAWRPPRRPTVFVEVRLALRKQRARRDSNPRPSD